MLRVVEHFEASDTGRARRANEDAVLARAPLFVVADGMGGAQAGEVASQIAVDAFEAGLPPSGSVEERLALVTHEANARIHELARADRQRAGMGTTLTAALLEDDAVALAHVGDSRAYRLRGGRLERLTRDHSLVEELIRQGKLTEAEAAEHPQRSVILRALGPEPGVAVDTRSDPARAGDVFLLCSDGLTSMLGEAEIEAILVAGGSLREAGERLVDEANRAGGRDNITVILFRLDDDRAPAVEATEQPTRVVRAAPSGGDRRAALAEQPTRVDLAAPSPVELRAAMGARAAVPAAPAEPPSPRSPQAPTRAARRRHRTAPLAAGLVVLALFASALWIATRAVFFVGTNAQGAVTIFRGLPFDGPGGLRLYESYYESGVVAATLPAARREALLDHRLRARDDAADLVDRLETGRLR